MIDIHKAGGIILKDKKILLARSKAKDLFIAPGGKLEQGETPERALARELFEELQIIVKEEDLEMFGTYYAQAAGSEDKKLQMDVFIVKSWAGEIVPSAEVEEICWSDSKTSVKTGSIFEHDVIPELKKRNLID